MKPRNKIYFFSLNKLADDESFDEDLRDIMVQVNLMTINEAIKPKKYENSLFVFDDILDVNMSLDPEDVFGEVYTYVDLPTQIKMEEECDKKRAAIKVYLNKSVKNILNQGRTQCQLFSCLS
jgi:hypothetical protein